MSCKVPYIEQTYRKEHPEVADKLTDIYHEIWKKVVDSGLFRKWGETYLYSKPGTKRYKSQQEFQTEIDKEYKGSSLIQYAATKSGTNQKVLVNVHPLAQEVFERIQNTTNPKLTEDQSDNINMLKSIEPMYNRFSNEDIQYAIEQLIPDSKIKEVVFHGVTKGKKAFNSILEKGFDFKSKRNWDSSNSKLGENNTGMFFSDIGTGFSYGADFLPNPDPEIANNPQHPDYMIDNSSVIAALLNINYLDDTQETSSGSAANFYQKNKHKSNIGMSGIEGGSEGVHHNYVVFESSQITILNSPETISKITDIINEKNGVTEVLRVRVRGENDFVANGEVFQTYEDAQNALNKDAEGTFYQLDNQEQGEQSIKELDTFLLNFMTQFGVQSQDFDELKSRLGIDVLGATDVINKLIWYNKDRNQETVPEEVGHMAVMLMGKSHPDIKGLLNDITNWEEYPSIYQEYIKVYKGNEQQVKIEAIGKLIAKSLVKTYKANGVAKDLLAKVMDALTKMLSDIKHIFSTYNFSEHLADKIAVNILMGNTNYIAKLKKGAETLDYNKAIDNNPHAQDVLKTFGTDLGFPLTGSLAIAGQGEGILRSSETPIHDLDFVVDGADLEKVSELRKRLKEYNAVPIHSGWEHSRYTTFAYLIPKKGYSIEVTKKKKGWVKRFKVYDEQGNQVDESAQSVIATDFFVHKVDIKEEIGKQFASVDDIYLGKLALSSEGPDERMFQRDKDISDYQNFDPKNRQAFLKPEFIYYQSKPGESEQNVDNTDAAESSPMENSEPTPETEDEMNIKIGNFLQGIGVSVSAVEKINDAEGNPVSAFAKADMLNKVIQVVNGSMKPSILGEEAAHFLIEMLPADHPLLKEMMEDITKFSLYGDIVQQYKDRPEYRTKDGKIDFTKIKKEAAAQLISKILNKEDLGNDNETNKVDKWWDRLLNYVKSFFSKTDSNPFRQAADLISGNNTEDLDQERLQQVDKEDSVYFHLDMPFSRLVQTQSESSLDNTVDPATGQKRHIYIIKGLEVLDTVTRLVKEFYKKIFPTDLRSEIQKKIDDLKAGFGDVIHEEMKTLFLRYVDPVTYLKRESPEVKKDSALNTVVYNKLEKFVSNLVNQYPEGTMFMPEFIVHDPNKKMAGTIDLIVLKPDSTAEIFDWKSQEIYPGQTTIAPFKEEAYRIQLNAYAAILKKYYGVTDVTRSWAIPIKTEFKSTKNTEGVYQPRLLHDIEIVGLQNLAEVSEEKAYLLPIIGEADTSGDKKLDALIYKLNGVREKLSAKKVRFEDRAAHRIELDRIRKAITDLQVRNDIKSFVKTASAEINKYARLISDPKVTLRDLSDAKDNIELYQYSLPFLEEKFRELTKMIEAETDDKEKESLLNVKHSYTSMILNASSLTERLDAAREKLLSETASDLGVGRIDLQEKPIGMGNKFFRSISQIPIASVRLFYKMKSHAEHQRNMEREDLFETMGELSEKLKEWGARKGIAVDDLFNGMLQFKDGAWTGNFLSRYENDFYKFRDNAIKAKDYTWIKNNTVFDDKAYEEGLKSMTAMLQAQTFDTDSLEERDSKYRAELKKWIDKYSKDSTISLSNTNNWYRKPATKYQTKQWNDLQKEKPLKDMYEFFRDLVLESQHEGMLNYKPGFIPSINKTMLENILRGDLESIMSKDRLLNKFAIEHSNRFPEIDPISGKAIREVPVHFTKDLGVDKDGKRDYSNKSKDLFKVFTLWINETTSYKAMSSIRDTANALVDFERIKSTRDVNEFGESRPSKNDKNLENADYLERLVNYYVYGDKAGKGDFRFNWKGKTYSVTEGVRGLIGYYTYKTLAMSWLSGTSTFVGGTGNALMQAAKGRVFTSNDWRKAMGNFMGNSEKVKAMLEYLSVEIEDRWAVKANEFSTNKMVRNVTSDKPMFMLRKGDQAVQEPVALAMLMNFMVVDGKIVHIGDYVKSKNGYDGIFDLPEEQQKEVRNKIEKEVTELKATKSIDATYEYKDKKISIPGIKKDSPEFANFLNRIKKMNKNIIGNASSEDISMIRNSLLGSVLLQFRSWMPQMVIERVGGLNYDSDTNTYDYGKSRQLIKHLATTAIMPLLKELVTGIGANTINRAKERYADFVVRMESSGQEFNMTETEFIDMYLGNIHSQIREMQVMMAFISMYMYLSAGPAEDRGKLRRALSRAFNKYQNEFSFYYSPTEFKQMIKNPLPIQGLIDDVGHLITHTAGQSWGVVTGDEKMEKKYIPTKYFGKMVPIVKEGINVTASVSEEFRKAMGIK